MMNIASVLLRCPGFFFPFCPLSCALFCFQWPVPMTLLRGLLSGYWSCFAYSLREPEVPPIHILSRTGLSQPPSSTQACSPESLPGLGKSQRLILCSRSPACGICIFGELFYPLSNMVNSLANFSWEHFLANDLSTDLHFKSSPGQPRLITTGAKFYVKHVRWNW